MEDINKEDFITQEIKKLITKYKYGTPILNFLLNQKEYPLNKKDVELILWKIYIISRNHYMTTPKVLRNKYPLYKSHSKRIRKKFQTNSHKLRKMGEKITKTENQRYIGKFNRTIYIGKFNKI